MGSNPVEKNIVGDLFYEEGVWLQESSGERSENKSDSFSAVAWHSPMASVGGLRSLRDHEHETVPKRRHERA